MNISRKMMMGIVFLITALTLSACSSAEKDTSKTETESHGNMNDHSGMNHSGSGEIPEGLKEAENPTYEVGSQAVIKADHMEGMNGAEATIVGAYDTTAYIVSYTPTTGGKRVEDHKWVIHEEMKDAGDKNVAPGNEVILEADHMKGMNGATAEIDSADKTTVYMVDYTPVNGGEKVTNHKWVTESELSAK